MPVSYLPCITPLLLIAVPLLFLAKGRKPFFFAACISAGIFALIFLWVYVPGWALLPAAYGEILCAIRTRALDREPL